MANQIPNQIPTQKQAKPMADDGLPVRKSPYCSDWSFRFATGFFRLIAAACFVIALLMIIAIGFGLASNAEALAIFRLLPFVFYFLGAGCVAAGLDFILRLLADIEQHTFRTAQLLQVIATSKRPKTSVTRDQRTAGQGSNTAS